MRQAAEMAKTPEFQAQMKKLQESRTFQESIKKTQEVMKDPEKLAELETKVQNAVKEGTEALEAAEKQAADKTGKTEGESQAEVVAEKDEAEVDVEIEDVPVLNLN